MRPAVFFVPLVLLSGCMTPAQRQAAVDAQDDARCLSYGVGKGSDSYVACRMQIAQIRAREDEARQAAYSNMMLAGAAMMTTPASVAPPPPPPQQPVVVNVQTAPICVRGPWNTISCR